MIRTVLVPVDESAECLRALPVAAAVAEAASAEVELVTVDTPGTDVAEMGLYQQDLVAQLPPAVKAHGTICLTDLGVADQIAELARERPLSLVCMATDARSALGELLLGSVGDTVVRKSLHPVLLVGPACTDAAGTSAVNGTAVAALDGSPGDADVVSAATDWARAVGTDVLLVHVTLHTDAPGADDESREQLAHWKGQLADQGIDADWLHIDAGDPGRAILRILNPKDGVLIVGSHRRGPIGRLINGSNALWLAHHAPRPVLVAGSLLRVGETADAEARAARPLPAGPITLAET